MFENLFPVEWSSFHFLRPAFLWFLIPVVIVFVTGLLVSRQEVKWKSFISPALRPYVIRKGSENIKTLMHGFLALALIFAVLGLSGPTWKMVEVPEQELETPMVIILDLSESMNADDIQPTRLERSKFKVSDLLDQNPKARVAVVGYAGTAHTVVPLARDYQIAYNIIESVSTDIMPFMGSDLVPALNLSDSLMSVTDAPGHIILFSDNTDQEQFEAIQVFVSQSQHSLTFVPVNTPSGEEVTEGDGSSFRSALNENVLNQINSLESVTVQRLTLDDSDMQSIATVVVSNLVFTDQPEETTDDWRDAGLIFLLPAGVFLLFWFRKGWVLYLFPLFVLSGCSGETQFRDLWLTSEYQAQLLSNKGEFEQAAELFEDPVRQGVAYYKAGDFEAAINAFSQDTSAESTYNLGLSYFMNGDIESARMIMGMVAENSPEFADEAREMDQQMETMASGTDTTTPQEAQETGNEQAGQEGEENVQNSDPENLGGGGQEANEQQMNDGRKEETVATDTRIGEELEEVPDDVSAVKQEGSSKVLMRKVADDPAEFLRRKFQYQVDKKNIKPRDHRDE